MNKEELINDLRSKVWCDGINGEPQLQEVKADGGKWYTLNIREIQGGNVVIYRNIHFYVIDEGLKTEAAYYKDAVPDAITNKEQTFSKKVSDYAEANENVRVETIEEEQKFAVIKQFVETETSVTEKKYLVKEVEGKLITKEVI